MFDFYLDRIETENRELRSLLSLGDGWPEVMKQREQGATDLAERLERLGSEAEWELTGACQLPFKCVTSYYRSSVHLDPPYDDTLILVQRTWIGRDREIHTTRVRGALVPNQYMNPSNEAAESIHEAWLRSTINLSPELFGRGEAPVSITVRSLHVSPTRAFQRVRMAASAVRQYWRRITEWAHTTRRVWTLYDHRSSHSGRAKPVYVKLLLAI